MSKLIPIHVQSLFRPLDQKLMELLSTLNVDDWHKQTVAKKWKVKDVVSHLLDGNLRVLSMQRDRYFGVQQENINGYHDLVAWLNQLNADWVSASKRLSSSVLCLLHQATGSMVCDYYEQLDLEEQAIFAVDWAGESESKNWMHLAREYTEKWHHQQQIRTAVGHEGIMTPEFFHPCIDTFFRALPYTFQDVQATAGTVVQATVTTAAGGHWYLTKTLDSWTLTGESEHKPDAVVEIPAHISWKLFSKSIRAEEIVNLTKITGDQLLGKKVLEMVAVMA